MSPRPPGGSLQRRLFLGALVFVTLALVVAGLAIGLVLYRFAREMREGDFVLLHQGRGKGVNVCRVTGEYDYDGAHRRPIRYVQRLLPGDISAGAQQEITYASASVLFEVRRYAPEFLGDMGEVEVPEDGTAAERFAVRWARHKRFMEKRKAVTTR